MFLMDLFKRDNVKCPKWLSKTNIEDDWINSDYSFDGNTHKWHLKTPSKDVHIHFDYNEYHLIAFNKNNEMMFDNIITEEYSIFC